MLTGQLRSVSSATDKNNETVGQDEPNGLPVETSSVSITDGDAPSTRLERNIESVPESTRLIVDALKSISTSRSQSYFVSNFDPAIHDIDAWCQEVERAKNANNWQDAECLSRVSNCLKGDARTWLNEWVTTDRTCSNFMLEFKPLCPRKQDYANILYEVMSTSSDKFTTYAEYARRSLLRLRIIKGLSAELMVSIVIRGITDPQVRVAAANADLTSEDLISFLSIYHKPTRNKFDSHHVPGDKRHFSHTRQSSNNKCFTCGRNGHKQAHCPKKPKFETKTKPEVQPEPKPSTSGVRLTCDFCKKPGHAEASCFAKEKA